MFLDIVLSKMQLMTRLCIVSKLAHTKKYDNFAKALNLPCKMMSACAVAVFNTELPDSHPDFIKIFWEVQEGADYLNFLRSKK